MLFLSYCFTRPFTCCARFFFLTTFYCNKMSKDYLATNLLIETLTLNLASYEPGPKTIDTFTLDQIGKLMKKLEQFLATCELVPFEEDGSHRDKIMMCFYQQPDTVRCRHCSASFTEYAAATQHVQIHDHGKEQNPEHKALPEDEPNIAPASNRETVQIENRPNGNSATNGEKPQKQRELVPSLDVLKKRCLAKQNFKYSKSLKKFLKKNIDMVIDMALAEGDEVKSASENKMMVEQLVECLKPHYPAVKCYPFGSRIVGTGCATSDLDIFVDLQEVYYGRNDKPGVESITESILKVEKILKNTKQWTIDEIILNCRVPLLRVISHEFGIQCDLTFSNGLAHRNSLLLEYMFNLQPTCRMLVCYLKQWSRERSLNGYTISLMVIFLFQLMDCLPSVASLQLDPKNDLIIDGWNAGFATPTLEELNIKLELSEMKELADNFFQLYSFRSFYTSWFTLETQIISPFHGPSWGCPLLKKHFGSPNYSKVPATMERLKRYLLEHKHDTSSKYQFAYDRLLVVQDPFELCHNVAKALPAEVAIRIVHSFELSAKLLNAESNKQL
ncbi:terminal uridylyltransferase Tailor [Anopheles gambiae]|uniref:terminal uridylyltransferase Tailor n=1 Tax=Anopheles gambiae TaxID=7165 RepID=UPI002AC9A0D6|nr:terminal uridylyltransferase Tailor [Anopheles gambiae]